jgi:hypothetical protein
VAFGGCATMGGPADSRFVSDVQAITSTACKFLPTADTIVEIVATGAPEFKIASEIAKAICAAIATPSRAAPGARRALPTVAGVPVRGQPVR